VPNSQPAQPTPQPQPQALQASGTRGSGGSRGSGRQRARSRWVKCVDGFEPKKRRRGCDRVRLDMGLQSGKPTAIVRKDCLDLKRGFSFDNEGSVVHCTSTFVPVVGIDTVRAAVNVIHRG
jgi:hypothetical protein